MLATKFGLVPHADGKGADVVGTPEHARKACEASLKRLQTDYIDLYYQHRVDRKVGIEATVKELKVWPNPAALPHNPCTGSRTCAQHARAALACMSCCFGPSGQLIYLSALHACFMMHDSFHMNLWQLA